MFQIVNLERKYLKVSLFDKTYSKYTVHQCILTIHNIKMTLCHYEIEELICKMSISNPSFSSWHVVNSKRKFLTTLENSVLTALVYLFLSFIWIKLEFIFMFLVSWSILIFYLSQTENCCCFSYQTAHYLSWFGVMLPENLQIKFYQSLMQVKPIQKIFILLHNFCIFLNIAFLKSGDTICQLTKIQSVSNTNQLVSRF